MTLTTVNPALLDTQAQYTGFKNRIINGGMTIDQRNAGASVTPVDAAYTVDRWLYNFSQASKVSLQQNAGSVTPPAGFRNYLGLTVVSSYTLGSSDYNQLLQPIEGFNTADLMWGTANAAAVTLSFWVRSSLTGTFGGSLRNSSITRSYPFTYTINAANTWEQKTITVAGDTSGTWLTTNGIGIYVNFSQGAGTALSGPAGAWAGTNYSSATGATSVVGTSGATFYITGVQLEKGSTATSFDYRPYGTELGLCQRYFEKSYLTQNAIGSAGAAGYTTFFTPNTAPNSQAFGQVFYRVTKRASPTVTVYGYGGTSGTVSNYSGVDQASGTGSADATGFNGFILYNGSGGSFTTSNNWVIFQWASSAEL